MSALIALIAGDGTLARDSIVALAALGALGVSLAAWEHGWLRAPFAIGTPLRAAAGLLVIWGIWGILVYSIWPKPSIAIAHVFNSVAEFHHPRENPFVNVYFQNTGERKGVFSVYSFCGVAPDDESQRSEIIKEVREGIDKAVNEGVTEEGHKFLVEPRDAKFFTVHSPPLSVQQRKMLDSGAYALYFAVAILTNESNGRYESRSDFCGFVDVLNPRAIVQCPEPETVKQQ